MLKCTTLCKIDWSELDLFGHVNNVMFFKYMQAARLRFCEEMGLSSLNKENSLSFMVASSRCDFKEPLHYPGEVKVLTIALWVKNTSFALSHQLYNNSSAHLAAVGEDVLVLYDYTKRSKVAVTPELRSMMVSEN